MGDKLKIDKRSIQINRTMQIADHIYKNLRIFARE